MQLRKGSVMHPGVQAELKDAATACKEEAHTAAHATLLFCQMHACPQAKRRIAAEKDASEVPCVFRLIYAGA